MASLATTIKIHKALIYLLQITMLARVVAMVTGLDVASATKKLKKKQIKSNKSAAQKCK